MAWSKVDPVTTVTQLAGVDALSLIAMIAERAKVVRRNKRECGELATDAGAIQGVLRLVQLRQHPAIDDLVQKLEAVLREACVLVAACEARSYLRRFFRAGRLAEQFQRIRQRIQFYVDLFPIISHVDTTQRLIRIVQRVEEPQAQVGPTARDSRRSPTIPTLFDSFISALIGLIYLHLFISIAMQNIIYVI